MMAKILRITDFKETEERPEKVAFEVTGTVDREQQLQSDLRAYRSGRMKLTTLQRAWPSEYNSHRGMLQRRKEGADIHPRFVRFADFLETMGPVPFKGWTVDRIDPTDPEYAPAKCRWASKLTQTRNRANTIRLTCSRTGDTRTLAAWAEYLGLSYSALLKRQQRRTPDMTDDEVLYGRKRRHPRGRAVQPVAPASWQQFFYGWDRKRLVSFRPFDLLGLTTDEAQQLHNEYNTARWEKGGGVWVNVAPRWLVHWLSDLVSYHRSSVEELISDHAAYVSACKAEDQGYAVEMIGGIPDFDEEAFRTQLPLWKAHLKKARDVLFIAKDIEQSWTRQLEYLARRKAPPSRFQRPSEPLGDDADTDDTERG